MFSYRHRDSSLWLGKSKLARLFVLNLKSTCWNISFSVKLILITTVVYNQYTSMGVHFWGQVDCILPLSYDKSYANFTHSYKNIINHLMVSAIIKYYAWHSLLKEIKEAIQTTLISYSLIHVSRPIGQRYPIITIQCRSDGLTNAFQSIDRNKERIESNFHRTIYSLYIYKWNYVLVPLWN